MKKKQQRLADLPMKYVKIGRTSYWLDTHTGVRVHNSQIHKHTLSFKATKDELIREKRYDLK